MKRIGISLALVTALLLVSPGMASAAGPREDRCVALMIMDTILVRPISAVVGIAASGFYVALAPITWSVGCASETFWGEQMWDDMVVASWDFTVRRPLGDFSR